MNDGATNRSSDKAIRRARELMETVRLVYSKHVSTEHSDPKSGIYEFDHPQSGIIHETLTGGFGGPIWSELTQDTKELLLGRALGLHPSYRITEIHGLEYEDIKPMIASFLSQEGKTDYERMLDDAAGRGSNRSLDRGGPER